MECYDKLGFYFRSLYNIFKIFISFIAVLCIAFIIVFVIKIKEINEKQLNDIFIAYFTMNSFVFVLLFLIILYFNLRKYVPKGIHFYLLLFLSLIVIIMVSLAIVITVELVKDPYSSDP